MSRKSVEWLLEVNGREWCSFLQICSVKSLLRFTSGEECAMRRDGEATGLVLPYELLSC